MAKRARKTAKRSRSPKASSIDGAMAAIQNAASSIPPPRKMDPRELVIWIEVTTAKSRDEWTDSQLGMAADLVRVRRRIEIEANKVEKEGSVTVNTKTGARVRNPRCLELASLRQQRNAMERALRIHANAVADHPNKVAGKREAERTARELGLGVPDAENPFLPFGGGSRSN